jgi:hypothetical protein
VWPHGSASFDLSLGFLPYISDMNLRVCPKIIQYVPKTNIRRRQKLVKGIFITNLDTIGQLEQ